MSENGWNQLAPNRAKAEVERVLLSMGEPPPTTALGESIRNKTSGFDAMFG
jgi:hypothetical protein